MASSYQTLTNVYSDVRYAVQKDSNTVADSDLLRIANKYFLWMVRELGDIGNDLYAQISTADLVADQREYPLPVNDEVSTYGGGSMQLIRVEVSYSGEEKDWVIARPIDLDSISTPLVESRVEEQFNKNTPYFAQFDRSVWLLPRPGSSDNVAADNANLRIFYTERPDELVDGDSIPSIPKDFLNILSAGMRADVLQAHGRTAESQAAKNEFFVQLERAKELETQISQPIVITQQLESWK